MKQSRSNPRRGGVISSTGTGAREQTPIEHGTQKGYKQHRRRGQVACTACKAAHSAVERERKPKKGRAPAITVETIAHGTDRGYHQHRRLDTIPCDPCRVAHNATTVATRNRNWTPSVEGGEINHGRHLRNGKLSVPLEIFVELYWTASASAVDMIDDHYGADKVDQWIKANEEAQGG